MISFRPLTPPHHRAAHSAEISTRSAEDDICDALPNNLIRRIHRAPAPLCFQPTLVSDDYLDVWNLGPDEFRFAIHRSKEIKGSPPGIERHR